MNKAVRKYIGKFEGYYLTWNERLLWVASSGYLATHHIKLKIKVNIKFNRNVHVNLMKHLSNSVVMWKASVSHNYLKLRDFMSKDDGNFRFDILLGVSIIINENKNEIGHA